MSTGISKDLVFLILQFLDEEKYKQTIHKLETESGVFCNMDYIEELVMKGYWELLDKYLANFININENEQSIKMLFHIRKQRYIEALEQNDRSKALEILKRDLKPFKTLDENMFKDLTHLLTLKDIRENEQLRTYIDNKTERSKLVQELKNLYEANPVLHEKRKFPTLSHGRLRLLVNQGLNWQHKLCENPSPDPEVTTLFEDHVCGPSQAAPAPAPAPTPAPAPAPAPAPVANNQITRPIARRGAFFHPEFHDFHPVELPVSLRAPRSQELEDQIMSDAIVEPPVVPSGVKEITEPSQILSLRLPDTLLPVEVLKIVHYGDGILALAYNAVHKLWKWPKNAQTQTASVDVAPQLCQLRSGILMTNDIKDVNLEDKLASLAISDNHCYAVSTSGGKTSLYNLATFKTMSTFLALPQTVTSLIMNPVDNNIVIAGMLDGSIIFYNAQYDKIEQTLKGHEKCVTGLAFVFAKNDLISVGTDGQLCVWNTDSWKMRTSQFIEFPARRTNNLHAPTRVYLNPAQTHIMVVQEKQIAVFDRLTMGYCIKWAPRDTSGAITDAVYSCDGESIFVCVEDGSVGVLATNTVELKCWINSAAYMPSNFSAIRAHPNSISAHPNKPNQFVLGLSDGKVYLLELPTNTGSDQMMVD